MAVDPKTGIEQSATRRTTENKVGYDTDDDLPEDVKRRVPEDGRSTWREAYNKSFGGDRNDSRATSAAIAAIKQSGYREGPDGVFSK